MLAMYQTKIPKPQSHYAIMIHEYLIFVIYANSIGLHNGQFQSSLRVEEELSFGFQVL